MAKPDKLNIIWGSGGVSTDPGDVKFALGWEAEIPPYQYFNYYQNKVTQMLDHVNTYGVPEWDILTEYKLGSRVLHAGILYRCTKATSTGALPTALVDWVSMDEDQSTNTTDAVTFTTVDTGYGANDVVPEDVTFDTVTLSVTATLPVLAVKQTGHMALNSSGTNSIKTPTTGNYSYSYTAWDFAFTKFVTGSQASVAPSSTIIQLSSSEQALIHYTRLS